MRWPPPTSRIGPLRMIQILLHLYGLGLETATYLVRELSCRPFRHRRAVAAFAGLTGTPFRSGECEQGISKIGNPRLRRMVMQLAWRWLRFQRPEQQRAQPLVRPTHRRRQGPHPQDHDRRNGPQASGGVVALCRERSIARGRPPHGGLRARQ